MMQLLKLVHISTSGHCHVCAMVGNLRSQPSGATVSGKRFRPVLLPHTHTHNPHTHNGMSTTSTVPCATAQTETLCCAFGALNEKQCSRQLQCEVPCTVQQPLQVTILLKWAWGILFFGSVQSSLSSTNTIPRCQVNAATVASKKYKKESKKSEKR